MFFSDRIAAGQMLAKALEKYRNEQVIVLALPRGGVILANEIAEFLKAPLDLIFAHKIGHPSYEEFAIGAMSESGHLVIGKSGFPIQKEWFEKAKQDLIKEIKRKRNLYLQGRESLSLKGKIAILVDDGIATGLTMQAAILEAKNMHPRKIVIAVPIAPKSMASLLKQQADEFIGEEIPDEEFLGAVGAYYQQFSQVEDDEVMEILENYQGPDKA